MQTTSASCNGWHHHRCKECLRQWLKEKCHQCKLWPVTTTMCASGVLVLFDRRRTPQVQGAKSGRKVQRSGQKTSGPVSVQVGKGCSNNIQLQPPPPPPPTRTNTARCSNHCNLHKGTLIPYKPLIDGDVITQEGPYLQCVGCGRNITVSVVSTRNTTSRKLVSLCFSVANRTPCTH